MATTPAHSSHIDIIQTYDLPQNIHNPLNPRITAVRLDFDLDIPDSHGTTPRKQWEALTTEGRDNIKNMFSDYGNGWLGYAEDVEWLSQVEVAHVRVPELLWRAASEMVKQVVRGLMEKFWDTEGRKRRMKVVVEGCSQKSDREELKGIVEGVGFECGVEPSLRDKMEWYYAAKEEKDRLAGA